MNDRSEISTNCQWRAETCCLLRDKLLMLEIARDHRAAGGATPLAPRTMHERMLEISADEDLCCPGANGGDCPFASSPKFDKGLCELSVNGFVILQLHKRRNQYAVLCAFEDQGWPRRIEWPLDCDAENGHRDTVKSLNRGQKLQLIKFSCDGSGCGVRWEFVR